MLAFYVPISKCCVQQYTFSNYRTAGAIILKLSHGYTIEPEGPDPLVDLADEVLLEFALSTQPGLWMVDVLPFCVYFAKIPSFHSNNICAFFFTY